MVESGSRRVVNSKPPCRFFQEGRCANPACTFRHVPHTDTDPASGRPTCGASAGTHAGSRRVVRGAPLVAGSVEGLLGGGEADRAAGQPAETGRAAAADAKPARARASIAPIVALAGLDVASAAMAQIAGRQVLQPRASARGGAAAGARADLDASDPTATAAPCRFFCRTGSCERGDGCKYAHDADRVALCRAFLAGNRSAPPCADFAHGYCARGLRCTDQHLLACEDWASSGTCARGDECPLRRTHRLPDAGARKRARVAPGPRPQACEPPSALGGEAGVHP
ncbi:hypothetical protein KFE25_009486 [Diacronema lutheri]|uniref:C3H1-type domain-containing protein n=1 Tax=Diacronema lutheri TaxID=2081491 RepID=A0A8J6CI76_DIALT|nr:hypothetical protein KFE25_009486 [Diacronema lutheri]